MIDCLIDYDTSASVALTARAGPYLFLSLTLLYALFWFTTHLSRTSLPVASSTRSSGLQGLVVLL